MYDMYPMKIPMLGKFPKMVSLTFLDDSNDSTREPTNREDGRRGRYN